MPTRREPTGYDPIALLSQQVKELQRQIEELRNDAYPMLPVYNYDALPPDPLEGQQAIIVNAPDVPTEGTDPDAIHYDVVNTGGFLEIRTTDTSEEGIYILDTGGGIDINADGPDGLDLSATDWVTITSSSGMNLNVGGGENVYVMLSAVGCKFQIHNHSGDVLLRVTEDGTYHIKSGASWVADL